MLNSLERTDSLLLRVAESKTRAILYNWGSDALGNAAIPPLWELQWRTLLKWVSKIEFGVWNIHYLETQCKRCQANSRNLYPSSRKLPLSWVSAGYTIENGLETVLVGWLSSAPWPRLLAEQVRENSELKAKFRQLLRQR